MPRLPHGAWSTTCRDGCSSPPDSSTQSINAAMAVEDEADAWKRRSSADETADNYSSKEAELD